MAANGITEKNDDKSVQVREETRASERYVKPPVTIIETEQGLTLIADIPGSVRDTLDVNIEKGVMTISAAVARSMPGRPVYTEFELTPYYRQFTIPEILDHERATANFANGLLTLKVPKAETAKPRKIEIKVV
jgi:HSP20 family protein